MSVKYQVTAEFPNGYLATEFATKFSTTRAASGKVVTIKRTGDRPQPMPLDGCTCGGIGDSGSHRAGCAWAL
jgi:hypothetical protein